MEILRQKNRCPSSPNKHWPLRVEISEVPGSRGSERGVLYKAVLKYRHVLGDMRTETSRFTNIKDARVWARHVLVVRR